MMTSSGGYSSHVEMYLVLDGRQVSVGQVGPSYFILDEAIECSPTKADLVIVVDGEESHVSVLLPHGASRTNCRIDYLREPATIPAI